MKFDGLMLQFGRLFDQLTKKEKERKRGEYL